MNCMKCGREVGSNQVFCSNCLELMAQRPVKSDVVIKLPHRHNVVVRKAAPRNKPQTPEEQIKQLQRRNRLLTCLVSLLLLVSLFFLSLCVDYFQQLDVQKLLGQNYSTVEAVE